MINNQRPIKCDRCGKDGTETVHADGFDDAPESFTIAATGRCEPRYIPSARRRCIEHTGLPLSGWSETRY